MPDNIPAHYTTQFSENWIHRVQQSKPRLSNFVEYVDYTGERKRFDRIGAQASTKRTERKGPTNISDPTTDSRWAYHSNYEVANLLDKDDAKKLGNLVLPDSDYVKSHAMAYNRDCDDVAWQAAINDVMTGEAGSTAFGLTDLTTAGDAGAPERSIAAGGTGLTLAKLITANEVIEDADLEDDAPRVICVTAKQLSDLLNETKIQDGDYAAVKALNEGKVNYFMGFHFVKIKRLPLNVSTDVRTCPVWVKGAIKVIKGAKSSDIGVRRDLSLSTQIYSDWDLGSTRVYDEGVLNILCDESP